MLRIAGEVDLLTLAVVAAPLDDALQQKPAHLVVDVAAVKYFCARAHVLLAQTARTAAADGIRYAVSGMQPHFDRIATMLRTGHDPQHYCSVAAAVTAIRAGTGDPGP